MKSKVKVSGMPLTKTESIKLPIAPIGVRFGKVRKRFQIKPIFSIICSRPAPQKALTFQREKLF